MIPYWFFFSEYNTRGCTESAKESILKTQLVVPYGFRTICVSWYPMHTVSFSKRMV